MITRDIIKVVFLFSAISQGKRRACMFVRGARPSWIGYPLTTVNNRHIGSVIDVRDDIIFAEITEEDFQELNQEKPVPA